MEFRQSILFSYIMFQPVSFLPSPFFSLIKDLLGLLTLLAPLLAWQSLNAACEDDAPTRVGGWDLWLFRTDRARFE